MKISETTKNIIIVLGIFIAGVLFAGYGINVSKIVNKTSDFFEGDNTTKKAKVSLVKCIDGDTVKLKYKNDKITARFLAIDTPEVKHPTKKQQKYGKEASNYTCSMLKKAKKIEISYENDLAKQDNYHRDLVWLWIDDELIQKKLLEKGYAKVRYIYAKYSYTDKLYEYQNEAQNKKIGIWENYVIKTYDNYNCFVSFNYTEKRSKIVEVVEGNRVEIVKNPIKENNKFVGWSHSGKLYDLSNPITKSIALTPIFEH